MGVLIIRILLFRVLGFRVPYFRKLPYEALNPDAFSPATFRTERERGKVRELPQQSAVPAILRMNPWAPSMGP